MDSNVIITLDGVSVLAFLELSMFRTVEIPSRAWDLAFKKFCEVNPGHGAIWAREISRALDPARRGHQLPELVDDTYMSCAQRGVDLWGEPIEIWDSPPLVIEV